MNEDWEGDMYTGMKEGEEWEGLYSGFQQGDATRYGAPIRATSTTV